MSSLITQLTDEGISWEMQEKKRHEETRKLAKRRKHENALLVGLLLKGVEPSQEFKATFRRRT